MSSAVFMNASHRGQLPTPPVARGATAAAGLRMRHVFGLIVLVAACTPGAAVTSPPRPSRDRVATPHPDGSAPAPTTRHTLTAAGLDPSALDRSADPCDDFYQFACGGWIARTEIPAEQPMANRSFVGIEDRNLEYLRTVLEQLRAAPSDAPGAKQLAAFYNSCMDEQAIEQAGTRPLADLRAVIDRVRDAKSLSTAVARMHADGFAVLFTTSPMPDKKHAPAVIIGIDQGGLGLPDRSYYLSDEAKPVRAKYQSYAAAMLVEMGMRRDAATLIAARILALETKIAKVSLEPVARRDEHATYNRIDKAGAAKAMPAFDWNGYWQTVGLAKHDAVTVTSTAFLDGLNPLVSGEPAELWRAYLTLHLATQAAGFLSRAVEDTGFQLTSALTGQTALSPRWKRCVQATDAALGDVLGQLYVRHRFSGASKAAAEQQVAAIRAAMERNLIALQWMDAQTRARAIEKLRAMTFQIGYPPKWRTYRFPIDPKGYGANSLAARRAETRRQLSKIGKPGDRDDWAFSPATVNAYNDPSINGMVFPAGILQPPLYSVDAALPVNLGAMGAIVGHELTHAFDDQGSRYDVAGNLANWWQPETAREFTSRSACLVEQYSRYTVAGDTHVNGATTLGENIADIGGLKLALSAHRALRAAAPDAVADGFTEEQQLFLGFAQVWCTKARPDFERMSATIDVHAPPKWRVNGTLSATPEFAQAFHCKSGTTMLPARQCTVW
jgi:putative endopeptidase